MYKILLFSLVSDCFSLTQWDTGGQNLFRTIRTGYYKRAVGVMIVYSATNEVCSSPDLSIIERNIVECAMCISVIICTPYLPVWRYPLFFFGPSVGCCYLLIVFVTEVFRFLKDSTVAIRCNVSYAKIQLMGPPVSGNFQ